MVLSVFPESRIIMFEPQEEMRSILEQLCRRNSNLEFIQAGVGREPGELVQTIWEDLAGSSFLPEVADDKLEKGVQRMTPIITIDEILKQKPDFVPDLVKLDIQGFELEALKGASSTFETTELFILETSLYEFLPSQPVTFDCIKFMHEKGYYIYDVTEYLRRPFDGALGQIDIAFAKSGGMLQKSNSWYPEQN